MTRAMKAAWRWFWALDRRTPWNGWAYVVGIGFLVKSERWLTGYPGHPPLALRVGLVAVTVALITAWLVLYERDAVRARRARRARRALWSVREP